MADGAPLGRVVVDVDLDANALRARVREATAKPFRVQVDFGKTQLRAALKEASADLKVKADVSFSRAQMQAELTKTAALLKPIKIPVTFNVDGRALKQIEKADAKRVASSQKTADKIKVIDAQASKSNAANIALRERLEFKSAERISRQQAAFRNSQLLAQKRLDNSLALISARAEARLAAAGNKPLFLNAVKGLQDVSSSLRAFDQTASRVLRTSLLAFTGWSAAVTVAMGAVAAAGVTAFAQLEQAATRAGVVVASQQRVAEIEKYGHAVSNFSAVTAKARGDIEKVAQRVALQTLFDPTEISQGIQALLQSGQTAEEAFKNIAASANFATVNERDLLETSEGLAKGLASAGLSANDSALLLDKISVTAASAVGNVQDYFDAFANGAGAAGKIIGATTDETLFVLRLLGQAGQLGLAAGTQTDIIFRDLGKAAVKAADEWEKYGITANSTVTEQLVGLAELIEKTGTNRVAQAKLRKELGLQEKSFRGLSRIIPQILELGDTTEERLAGVNRGIASTATGAIGTVDLQMAELRKNVSFQFDQLLDSLKIGFQEFGRGAGSSISDLFDEFAGAGGLLEAALPAVQKFGEAFGRMVRRVADFVKTDNFVKGIQTLVQAIKVTLGGVGEAFRQFSGAFTEGKEAQSTFESFADAVLAFSQLSARVLPEVARIIGEIVDLLIDNADVFEVFAKAAVGVFLLNKAFTLFVAPVVSAVKALGGMRNALGASGLAGGSGAAALSLARFAGVLGLVVAGVDFLAGAVKGARDEFNLQLGSSEELRGSLRTLAPEIEGAVNLFKDLGTAVNEAGQQFGKLSAGAVADMINTLAAAKEGDAEKLGKGLLGLGKAAALLSPSLRTGATAARGFNTAASGLTTGAAVASSGFASLTSFIDGTSAAADRLSLRAGATKAFKGILATRDAFRASGNAELEDAKSRLSAIDNEIAAASAAGSAYDDASKSVKELKDLTEEAQISVLKLSDAQRKSQSAALVARIAKMGEGYKATRKEVALLETAMPGLDKALEKQKNAVSALDDQLSELRNTQLKGSKAFSDAAFAFEQDVKKLQLQRLDLVAGGASEESPAVAALDAQIKAIQMQAERTDLVSALELDPLRRKLDETFQPVKELSFEQIIGQFRSLTLEQATQTAALAKQQSIQDLLAGTLERASLGFSGVDRVAKAAAASVASVGGAARAASAGLATLNAQRDKAVKDVKKFSYADQATKVEADAARKNTAANNATGRKIISDFFLGTQSFFAQRLFPGLKVNRRQIEETLKPNLEANGFATMFGFQAGMEKKFGSKKNMAEGTIAKYLHVDIPEMVRALKGPVAYDATILVPAGEAVMAGFDKGLRSGFGNVENFLKDVGPSMEESVPDSVFIKRTANFMYEVSKGNTPDPYEYFKDLVPQQFTGSFSGVLDPALNFLHKTASVADTGNMAAGLAKLFGGGMQVTALKDNHNQFTSSGNISDHFFGTAADLSNGSSPTPEMDALAAALKPLYGTIVKQLIWRDKDQNRGFPVSGHMNHVHVAFLKAANFALDSGRIGAPALFDIPGASNTVDAAINAASKSTGIDVKLLAAIAKQESRFNPRAISPAGAGGLFQLMPQTAAGLGVFNTFDPFANALGGAKYIKAQLKRFGSLDLALAAYNAGPGNVSKYGGVPPFSETINYIRNIKNFLREFGGSTKPFGGFRADGGAVRAGMKYMVNERGQEMLHSAGRYSMIRGGPQMLMPRSSGTVIDAETTKLLLDAAKGSGAKKEVAYSPTYKISTNTRDPRAVADVMDAKIRRQLQSVIM